MNIVWVIGQAEAGDVLTGGIALTVLGALVAGVVRVWTTSRDLTGDARDQAASAVGHANAERDYFSKELDETRDELTETRADLHNAFRRIQLLERVIRDHDVEVPPEPARHPGPGDQ